MPLTGFQWYSIRSCYRQTNWMHSFPFQIEHTLLPPVYAMQSGVAVGTIPISYRTAPTAMDCWGLLRCPSHPDSMSQHSEKFVSMEALPVSVLLAPWAQSFRFDLVPPEHSIQDAVLGEEVPSMAALPFLLRYESIPVLQFALWPLR